MTSLARGNRDEQVRCLIGMCEAFGNSKVSDIDIIYIQFDFEDVEWNLQHVVDIASVELRRCKATHHLYSKRHKGRLCGVEYVLILHGIPEWFTAQPLVLGHTGMFVAAVPRDDGTSVHRWRDRKRDDEER